MSAFCERLSNIIQQLANEGIPFVPPCIVLDHVAIHDLHLKHIIFLVRGIAANGQQMIDDGILLFKVKEVSVSNSGNGTEPASKTWMIIMNCLEIKANHAIYKQFNQNRAYQKMISAYVFDERGCKNPDETITAPLNVENFRVRVRQRPDPVFIDYRDSYRQPGRDRERKHLKKAGTGFPSNIYRGDVILPEYLTSRSSTPFSFGYASHLSDEEIQTQVDRRRVIDVTNSPRKYTEKSSNPTGPRYQIPKGDHRSGFNQGGSKENATARKRRVEREQNSNDNPLSVHERLGDIGSKEQKRFKSSTFGRAECSNGREGTGEKGRSTNNRDRRVQYNDERSRHRDEQNKRAATHREHSEHRAENRTTTPAQKSTKTHNHTRERGENNNPVRKSATQPIGRSDPGQDKVISSKEIRSIAQTNQLVATTPKQIMVLERHGIAPTIA